MARGMRRTIPIMEDANVDVTIANVLDTGLTFVAGGSTTHSIINDVKELEKKVRSYRLGIPNRDAALKV